MSVLSSAVVSSASSSSSVAVGDVTVTARHARLFQALAALHIELNPTQQAVVAQAARLDMTPTVQDLHTASYAVRALLALWVSTPPKHMQMLDMLSVAFGLRSLHAAQATLPAARTPAVTPWSYRSVPASVKTSALLREAYHLFPVLTMLVHSGMSVVFTEAVADQPDAWTDGTTLYLVANNFHTSHYTSVGVHALLDHPTALAQALEDPSIDPHLFALALDILAVYTFLDTPNWLGVQVGKYEPNFTFKSKKGLVQFMSPSLQVAYTRAFVGGLPHKFKNALAFWSKRSTPIEVYRVLCAVRDGTHADHDLVAVSDSMIDFVRTVASGSYATTSWAPSVVLPTQHARVHARQRATVLDLCSALQTTPERAAEKISIFVHAESTPSFYVPCVTGDAVFSGPSWTRVTQMLGTLQTVDSSYAAAPNTDAHHQALADVLHGVDTSDIARLIAFFHSKPLAKDMYAFASRVGWALHLADVDWACSVWIELALSQILLTGDYLKYLFVLPSYCSFGAIYEA